MSIMFISNMEMAVPAALNTPQTLASMKGAPARACFPFDPPPPDFSSPTGYGARNESPAKAGPAPATDRPVGHSPFRISR